MLRDLASFIGALASLVFAGVCVWGAFHTTGWYNAAVPMGAAGGWLYAGSVWVKDRKRG